MDTAPSPPSSSQDVTMQESETQDSGPTGYSQADYAASQAVGDQASSHAVVEEADAVKFLDSTVKEKQYEIWMLAGCFNVYLLGTDRWVYRALWPAGSKEQAAVIKAISDRQLVRLKVNLSYLFAFIHSEHTFPCLTQLLPWIDKECGPELERLRNVRRDFAPALQHVGIHHYSERGPQDITKWAVEHGVPLLVMLYKAAESKTLSVVFDHSTSNLREGKAHGLRPIEAALEKEEIACTMQRIILGKKSEVTKGTCNLMQMGFAH